MATLGIPFPQPDEYLAKVGKALYAINYLESGILGDVRFIPDLPPGCDEITLRSATHGQVVQALRAAAAAVLDPDDVEWLAVAAEVLERVSWRRNDLAHSRTATVGNDQRLVRFPLDGRDAVTIDDAWFEDYFALVATEHERLTEASRPATRYKLP